MNVEGNSSNEATIITSSTLLVGLWRNPDPHSPARDGETLISAAINALALMHAEPSANTRDRERLALASILRQMHIPHWLWFSAMSGGPEFRNSLLLSLQTE